MDNKPRKMTVEDYRVLNSCAEMVNASHADSWHFMLVPCMPSCIIPGNCRVSFIPNLHHGGSKHSAHRKAPVSAGLRSFTLSNKVS